MWKWLIFLILVIASIIYYSENPKHENAFIKNQKENLLENNVYKAINTLNNEKTIDAVNENRKQRSKEVEKALNEDYR